MNLRILVIEDDNDVARFIQKGLAQAGHESEHAADGESAWSLLQANTYDVIILDRMLPQLDGMALIQRFRETDPHTPVLFLSAKSRVEDRVTGLRAGADDYLTKPFALEELLARVEILAQRKQSTPSPMTLLSSADLTVDLISREVYRAGQRIDLQTREFRLLEYLLRNKGRVLTRTMLLENVWDYHFDPQTNVIDVHISRLRNKIDKEFSTPLIETVRGAGYRLLDM